MVHIHSSLSHPMAIYKCSLYIAMMRAQQIATDTDKQVPAHYIVFTEISGLYNDLCDLYNDQQYAVHCLAVNMSCMLRLKCKNVTVTYSKFCVSHKWLAQIQSTRAKALARAK